MERNSLRNSEKTRKPNVLDCTVRDGGLMNDSRFDDETVAAIHLACAASGVNYMEIGFKNSDKYFSRQKYGKWRFCDEDDIKKIAGACGGLPKIAVMADEGKCEPRHFLKKSESAISMVRCAFYAQNINGALDIIKCAADKGYETALCMMAASTLDDAAIEESLGLMSESDADVIYLMDSFGGMFAEDVKRLFAKYAAAAKASGKKLGIHTHNNMQQALSNTIEALSLGADFADASFAGLGKGAGNCQTEMLCGYLAMRKGMKFDMLPILEAVEKHIEPLRGSLKWGFAYPYMLTGLYNMHPRDAMNFQADGGKSVTAFYGKLKDYEKNV